MKRTVLFSAVLTTATLIFASCNKEKMEELTPPDLKVKLEARLLTSSPVRNQIQVSPNDDTEANMITFSIKAVNGNANLDELPVGFISSADPSRIIDDVDLNIKGNRVERKALRNDTAVFDDLDDENITILENDSIIFSVPATFESAMGNYPNGTDIQAILDVKKIKARDEENNKIEPDNITGSAVGEKMFLYTHALYVTTRPTTAIVNTLTKDIEFKVNLNIEAFGADRFIGKTSTLSSTINGKHAFAFVVEKKSSDSSIQIVSTGITTVQVVTSDAGEYPNAYLFKDEDGEDVTITVNVKGLNSPGKYGIRLTQIQSFKTDALTTDRLVQDLPAENFRMKNFVSL